MFTIAAPKLYEKDGELYYASHIKDDVYHIDEEIWYKSSKEFGYYFSHEVADSFVVACLLPAIHTSQDIYVDSPMSEKLYYHISNSVIDVCSVPYGGGVKNE